MQENFIMSEIVKDEDEFLNSILLEEIEIPKVSKKIDYSKIKYTDNDISILGKLYEIQSPSGSEKEIREHLIQYVQKIKGVQFQIDKIGNLLVTKNKPPENNLYPCIVAHMDTVHGIKKNVKIAVGKFQDKTLDGNLIWCQTTNEKGEKSDVGGAGDDKNGIFICLKMLEEKEFVKCVFFVSEEHGQIGSNNMDLKFFNDCSYILQSDRRNGGDLITTYVGDDVCNSEFKNILFSVGKKYCFFEAAGSITDVMVMKESGLDLSVVNFSSGYYAPHTKDEYTIIEELINANNFCSELMNELGTVKKYEHKFDHQFSYKNYFGKNKGGKDYYSMYDEYDDKDFYEKYYSHMQNDFSAESSRPNEINFPNKCSCTATDFHIGALNPDCDICNPIVDNGIESNIFCETCYQELVKRKYTFSCPVCGSHRLRVFQFNS